MRQAGGKVQGGKGILYTVLPGAASGDFRAATVRERENAVTALKKSRKHSAFPSGRERKTGCTSRKEIAA